MQWISLIGEMGQLGMDRSGFTCICRWHQSETMGVGILMEWLYNKSCFWFLFTVGFRPVTFKDMFLVHVHDWTFALRPSHILLNYLPHPQVFGCCSLHCVVSTSVILSIKVRYFSGNSIIPIPLFSPYTSLVSVSLPPQWP